MEIKVTVVYRHDWEERNDRTEIVLTGNDVINLAGEKLKECFSNDIEIFVDDSSIDSVDFSS